MIPLRRIATKKSVRIVLLIVVLLVLAESALRIAGYFYLQSFYKRQFEEAFGSGESINIICLGESSTAGLWVDWKDSYPKQMEKMLREFYGDPRIRVIVPVHVGQNSSQVSNRIDNYIELYRPKLIVAMMGYNNEWSLAESHIGQFIAISDSGSWKVRALIALDGLRLFKVLRYGYHSVFSKDGSQDRERLDVLGHPELVRYPPADWVYSFANSNRSAFVDLWRSDVKHVIDAARAHQINVLLMTYHINPTYLGSEEFVSLAADEKVPLVRNDIPFDALIKKGTISRYLLSDHWHPNRFGYALIAHNAFRQIAAGNLLNLPHGAFAGEPPVPEELQSAEEYAPYPSQGGIDFGSSGVQAFLGDGWSGPEPPYRWTDNSAAEILFALENAGAASLELKMRPFLAPGRIDQQRVTVTLNGRPLANWILRDSNPLTYSVSVPRDLLTKKNVLRFELPDARSPKELGVSTDARRLGIAVERMELKR